MKLSSKTIFFYLLFSLPLFLLGGWLLQRGIVQSMKHEVDEELLNGKAMWSAYLQQLPDTVDLTVLNIPLLTISKTISGMQADRFADASMYQPVDGHDVPYRTLTTYIQKANQAYRLTLQYTLVDKEDVVENIIRQMALIFIAIFLVFLLINYVINKTVWKPFYASLTSLAAMDIRHLEKVHFEKTSIKEFTALNQTLNSMTRKISNDYLSMKNFTENASHEVQTPLAIIQSKLELLLQDESLSTSQLASINAVSESAQRLSKLNQSLLLFTRIENNQFVAERSINAKPVIEKYLAFFEEMIEQKQLQVQSSLSDCYLSIHPMLLDMLISNLMSNAIRYNKQQGTLLVNLEANGLTIQNSSDLPAIDEEILFKRFARHTHPTGNGLGLAIVKEICDNNGLMIEYAFVQNFHQFTISR